MIFDMFFFVFILFQILLHFGWSMVIDHKHKLSINNIHMALCRLIIHSSVTMLHGQKESEALLLSFYLRSDDISIIPFFHTTTALNEYGIEYFQIFIKLYFLFLYFNLNL